MSILLLVLSDSVIKNVIKMRNQKKRTYVGMGTVSVLEKME